MWLWNSSCRTFTQNWFSLRKSNNCSYFFSNNISRKKSGEPVYLANWLGFTQPLNQNIGGRRRQNINCVNFRLAWGREGLLYHGSKLWNSLDIHLKNKPSITAFKKKSRNWVLENIPALLWNHDEALGPILGLVIYLFTLKFPHEKWCMLGCLQLLAILILSNCWKIYHTHTHSSNLNANRHAM